MLEKGFAVRRFARIQGQKIIPSLQNDIYVIYVNIYVYMYIYISFLYIYYILYICHNVFEKIVTI